MAGGWLCYKIPDMQPICLNNPLCALAEGPLWNVQEQALYWTDIVGRAIWRYRAENAVIEKVWTGEWQVGGFSFRRNGGFVLCTDGGIFTANDELGDWQKLHNIKFGAGERFNDVTTDPHGRIFAGTMEPTRRNGTLYRIDPGGTPVAILTNIGISNGMGFSADGKTFYHTDSVTRRISAYDYDANSGDIGNPRVFYQGKPEDGSPDGMTVDREDCIWTACWGAAQVLRLDANGEIIRRIAMPCKQPSSVMFGGKNLDTLFITSAHQGSHDDKDNKFLGGHVYSLPCSNIGRAEYLTTI